MSNTDFFADVEKIVLKDKLGELLGVDEPFVYSFADVVKLSGHSCPTVAGAYLMTLYSLKKLYSNETAIRGDVKVELRDSKSAGTTGVLANVASFITGAKEEDGFKGLNGKFARNNLLSYDADIKGEMRFTRVDTNESVEITYDLSNLALSGFDQSLMQKAIQGIAISDESKLFGAQWQKRVSDILLVHKDKTLKFL